MSTMADNQRGQGGQQNQGRNQGNSGTSNLGNSGRSSNQSQQQNTSSSSGSQSSQSGMGRSGNTASGGSSSSSPNIGNRNRWCSALSHTMKYRTLQNKNERIWVWRNINRKQRLLPKEEMMKAKATNLKPWARFKTGMVKEGKEVVQMVAVTREEEVIINL